MADKIAYEKIANDGSYIPERMVDNGDGTWSEGSGPVSYSLITPDVDMTQIVTVTTAGTPVQGPNKSNTNGWWIKNHPTATGFITFMFHGQTSANKGFPLNPGEILPLPIANLSSIDVDASVNGMKVYFVKA